jgi:integrase
MASLHKRNRSPFWWAAFTDETGKRRQRSTGQTEHEKAKQVLDGWQKAITEAKRGALSEIRIREFFRETYERVSGRTFYSPTVAEYLSDWLKSEKPTVSEGTHEKKEQAVRLLLKSLGDRSRLPVESVTEADIVRFRDELLAEGRYASTVNGLVRKFIAQAFRAAQRKGLIRLDPVAGLKAVRGKKVEKQTFTFDQIKLLLGSAKGDWKGMVLAGFYTGARLSDLANLTWGDIDLKKRTVTFVQRKTDTKIKIPIHSGLHKHLSSLEHQNGASPVFPTLYGKTSSGKSGLSMAFGRLMASAGIEQGAIRERTGGLSRKVSALSFHSLRHSFNTVLAQKGVPLEMRMKLTGHSSAEMNAVYTHTELQTIAKALRHLPRL